MPEKIKPLSFDSSKSARIRLFGKPAYIGLHYIDIKAPMLRMVCPDSMDGPIKCLRCKAGRESGTLSLPSSSSRLISPGWDLKENRWCFYVAPPPVFDSIAKAMIELGVSPIEIASGDGPDIILQRVGMQTHVAAMSETLGIERCREPFPDFEQAMRGVQKASLWSKFSSEKEVLSHLKEYDTFSDRPKPERVQEPRRAVEFVVKKPKLGDDRWDFMS